MHTSDDGDTINAWASSVRAIPALNATSKPYGMAFSTGLASYPEWVDDMDHDHDVAIIRVNRPIGALTGWREYAWSDDCDFFTSGEWCHIGYPAEKDTPYSAGDHMYERCGAFNGCDWWPGGNNAWFSPRNYKGESGSGAVLGNTVFGVTSFRYKDLLDRTYDAMLTSAKCEHISNKIAEFTPGVPDLIPLDVNAAPFQVLPGNGLSSLTCLLHNYSSATWTGTVNAKVFLSSDHVPDSSDKVLCTQYISGPIGPKSSTRVIFSPAPEIPANTPSGSYYVGVSLDSADAVPSNNATTSLDDYASIVVSSSVISPPTNLQASDGTYATKIHLTWNAVSAAEAYDLYRHTSNNFGSATWLGRLYGSSSTSFDDEDPSLASGQTYWYWVVSAKINPPQTSSPSSPDSGYLAGGASPSLAEAVDNTSLPVTTGGDAPWLGQTNTWYYDGDAAQSGAIGHSQESWMETTVTGPGTLKFFWKLSSQQNRDYLELYLDGDVSFRNSGSYDWAEEVWGIPWSRSVAVRWRYVKDGSISYGSDSAWVDKVEFIPNRPPDTPSLLRPPAGAINVSLTPPLVASGFSDPDGVVSPHTNSHWQVDSHSSFSSPEWDSGETAPANTETAVPSGQLGYSTTYYWRVRYKDSRGAWSNWSSSQYFTTQSPPNNPPSAPSLISPEDGARPVGLSPTLVASTFLDPDGDVHASSQWQVGSQDNFTSPVWDSGEVYPASWQATVPADLLEYGVLYYWRVRYSDSRGAWSEWSTSHRFHAGVYADLDGDFDVDQEDFGLLQLCLSGPSIPQEMAGCELSLIDGDNDIDQDDVDLFLSCMTLPGVLADARCRGRRKPSIPGAHQWECIPGVIRNDGVDSFRIEVHAAGEFTGVTLNTVSSRLIAPQTPPLLLRDDGVAPDRVAYDFIYSAGPFRYDPGSPIAVNYMNDASSPAGLDAVAVGPITISTGTGTESFAASPIVGVLSADVPPATISSLADDVAASPHLVNVRATGWNTQGVLRSIGGSLVTPSRQLYDHLPDAYDFMIFFSTNRLERTPTESPRNSVAGGHLQVQINYTGTGQMLMNNCQRYGSSGRLLGLVVLDAFDRGIYSANATHELLHQWSGVLPPALNLSDDDGHYNPRSNIGSLLGGARWIPNGDGTFTLDCTEGYRGARQASALDLYFMGLIYGAEWPDNIHTYSDFLPLPPFTCGQTVTADRTITIYDMVRQLGQRTPGPATAPRRFNILFVAESLNRMLTPTEMTYYEMLAAHYTLPLPVDAPPPYVGFNWAPITKFFGHGVTWSSLVNPADLDADVVVGSADLEIFTACAAGPGISYRQDLPPGCPLIPDASGTLRADLDGDGDVDQADFAFFQRLRTAE